MKGFEPLTPSLPWKCSTPELHRPKITNFNSSGCLKNGAEDETRTRDPQLGRLMLYQLSYFRVNKYQRDVVGMIGFEPIQA